MENGKKIIVENCSEEKLLIKGDGIVLAMILFFWKVVIWEVIFGVELGSFWAFWS